MPYEGASSDTKDSWQIGKGEPLLTNLGSTFTVEPQQVIELLTVRGSLSRFQPGSVKADPWWLALILIRSA